MALQLAVDRLESSQAADAGRGVFSRAPPPEGFVELTVAPPKEQLAPFASEVSSTQAAVGHVTGVASSLLQPAAMPALSHKGGGGGGADDSFDQEHDQAEQQRRPQQQPSSSASNSLEQRSSPSRKERAVAGELARARQGAAHRSVGTRLVGSSSPPDEIYLNPDTLLPMIKQPEPPAPWWNVSDLWKELKDGRGGIQSGEIAL